MIDTEIKTFAQTKKEAEEEIRRLQEVIENCDLNISNKKRDQEAKKDQAERNNSHQKAAEEVLKSEIKEMKDSLESNLKTVDDLMRRGLTWSVQSAWRLRGERSSVVLSSTWCVPSVDPGWRRVPSVDSPTLPPPSDTGTLRNMSGNWRVFRET